MCVLALTGLASGAAAQQRVQSPVLVVASDQMYLQSAFGRRITQELETERDALAAENRSIEEELEAEEQELTTQRATLEPETFRDLADAFDTKVQAIRREQDAKARALITRQEAGRTEFLNAAAPVIEALMLEAGAVIVMERRDVLLSLNAIDITEAAVIRIDAAIGDGADLGAGSPKE